MVGRAVFHIVIVCIWAMYGQMSIASETKATEATPQVSTPVLLTDVIVQKATNATDTRNAQETHATSALTKSEIRNFISTESETKSNFATTAETTVSRSSTAHAQIEQSSASPVIDPTFSYPVNPSTFTTNQTVSSIGESSIVDFIASSTSLLASTTFYSIELTEHLSQKETTLMFLNSEVGSWSTLFEGHSTVTSLPLSWSADTQGESSETVNEDLSSHVRPTPAVSLHQSSFSKSVSVITSSPTRTMIATATSESPSQKPSESAATKDKDKEDSLVDMSMGTKVAIGVIATVCVLAVVIAGIVVYRRYNITHRSLKSFLTSGVRYKTYNNATYKDDEGMLIMPDGH